MLEMMEAFDNPIMNILHQLNPIGKCQHIENVFVFIAFHAWMDKVNAPGIFNKYK